MARTRNLDPGRDPALHYAFTFRKRHAKRLVYALFLIASLLVGQGAGAVAPLPVGGGAEAVASLPVGQGQGVPCVACQALSVDAGEIAALPSALKGGTVLLRDPPADRVDGLLAGLRGRGGRVGLHLTRVPGPDDPRLAADVALLVIDAVDGDLEPLVFSLKQALAAARGFRPAVRLLVTANQDRASALRDRGLAPYVDEFTDPAERLRTADDLLAADPRSFRIRRLPEAPASAAVAVVFADLQEWFPEGLVAVPDRPLACGADRRVPSLMNPRTLDLVGVSAACAAPAPIVSDMPGAIVERYDLGARSAFLVRAGGGDRFAEGVDVAGARALTAEEIVARHQAAAARQAASIETAISSGTLALTFEAPGFVAPISVTSATTVYRGPTSEVRRPTSEVPSPENVTEIRQSNIRVNGVPFDAKGGVPRLPIIEPERVAAPPLTITLSDVYRYRLAGRETIRGRQLYVIAFEPRRPGESLFKGRAWIDAQTFGILRISATQTGLKGPVTASEQTDEFEPDAAGHWLLARSDIRQTYEGASVRTPIHRLLILDRHLINASDFTAQRNAAYASADVMLRDTPEGFRYLARAGSRKPDAGSGNPEAGTLPEAGSGTPEAVTRILAGRSERIRTVAFGVIIDPNISIPLPFAGLSYIDFNLFGTGTQFSGFYGGSYGQLAFSAPSIRGTRWQLAGRAFGIASSYNDRAFENGREQYPLAIRQRPAQAAVWVLRPLTSRTALRLEYDWDYNRYERADETAPEFLVPRSQNSHGIRVALEAQLAGWQTTVWGSYAHRIGWRTWGLAESTPYRSEHADFQRYGASVLRSGAVTPAVTTRIEAAVMGGHDLDRFSRYAFGTFDNRLHGYPSALVRYDKGAVLRTALAWALGPIRLDGFADAASVRDPAFGPRLRPYSGVGAALEAPGPFRTLLSLEWGYGFQGIDTDGQKGTHVLRLSGYKVF